MNMSALALAAVLLSSGMTEVPEKASDVENVIQAVSPVQLRKYFVRTVGSAGIHPSNEGSLPSGANAPT